MILTSLKKREDYVQIAKTGQSVAAKGLVLQVRKSCINPEDNKVQIGFTVTKKLGNAVVRNKIKRRLRAIASSIIKDYANRSFDYVLIGRKAALERDFNDLKKDLKYALHALNAHK
jgi:ribonuclease P protein component